MLKWIAKKVLIGKANDLLKLNEDNISKKKELVKVWIGRFEKVISCLKSILSYLDDNKIDAEEIDMAVDDMKSVIKTW